MQDYYNRAFRNEDVYKQKVDTGMSDEAFAEYQQRIALKNNTDKRFDPTRVQAIHDIATLLQQHHCMLTILKLPQSVYNDVTLNTTGYSYFDREIEKLITDNIQYINASDYNLYDIHHKDYIWPGHKFDPEHLNKAGSARFTKALMKNIIDSMFTHQTNIH